MADNDTRTYAAVGLVPGHPTAAWATWIEASDGSIVLTTDVQGVAFGVAENAKDAAETFGASRGRQLDQGGPDGKHTTFVQWFPQDRMRQMKLVSDRAYRPQAKAG